MVYNIYPRHFNLGRKLMTQCILQLREAEMVACGDQLARLNPPTAEDKLIGHLSHYEPQQESRYGRTWLLAENAGKRFSKFVVSYRVGTDWVDWPNQRFGHKCVLHDARQFIQRYPT